MSTKLNRIFLAAVLTACAGANAYAEGFDVQHFIPVAGGNGVFSVESSQTMKHLDFDIKLMTDYANTPLQYTRMDENVAKMEHLVTMNLSASIGIVDYLEFGVSMPFVPYEHFNESFGGSRTVEEPGYNGAVGDLKLMVKGTILKREKYHGFGLGMGAILSIPTGFQDAYVAGPGFWGRPYIAMDYEIGPVEMMLNTGFSIRKPADFLTYRLEHGFNYGFGINVHAVSEYLDVRGEIFGEVPLSSRASDMYQNSIEFLAGLKAMTPIGLNFTAGAGSGIGNGVRSPKYRVLFGIEFQKPGPSDNDGDGIKNRKDLCPDVPGLDEFNGCPVPDTDADGWCDEWVKSPEIAADFACNMTDACVQFAGVDEYSGCPLPDADGDGWCDAWIAEQAVADLYQCKMTDKCPDYAGNDDLNGCPIADTDNDGWCDAWVVDEDTAAFFNCMMGDRCPELPGENDFYGCPNADADGDGLCASFVDELGVNDLFFCSGNDKCPDSPEDFDNFEDEDGCNDPDNDHDGICDPWVSETGQLEKYAHICRGVDQCPLEAEIINGVKDDDGCPDKGKQIVFVHDDKIEIKEKIFFDNNKATIKKQSHSLLNQVAASIMAHPEIKHISVEGHTDDSGKYQRNLDLSYERAQSVVKYLVDKGIPQSKLSGIGYGPDRPLDPGKNAKARAKNRRVEFVITEREKK